VVAVGLGHAGGGVGNHVLVFASQTVITMEETVPPDEPSRTAPESTAADLRAELGTRELPRHLALFYRSKTVQLEAVAAYLAQGLQSGHRCVYLRDVNPTSDVESVLRDANVDVERRKDAGDIAFRDAADVYLDSGFDPERMIDTLESEAEASVEAGYEGLCVAGENSWCFHTDHSFDHVLDFEADFDTVCPDLPVIALCQYDLERFNERSAAKALWTHEQVIYRHQVCQNPFYIPAGRYRSTEDPHLNAQLMLEQAYSLTEANRDVERRQQRLEVVNRVLRHNVRNDLNFVRGILRSVTDNDVLDAESRERLEAAKEHTERVVEMAEKARYIQKTTGDPTVEPRELATAVDAAVAEVEAAHPSADVRVSGEPDVVVLADENLDVALREALTNGVVHQTVDTPTVSLSVSTPRADAARIEIRNEGSIPDADRHTLETGEETQLDHASGLGLWLIKWIVENAHGTIEFPNTGADEVVLRIELYRVPT
jgi:two-component sensor histidine kinase